MRLCGMEVDGGKPIHTPSQFIPNMFDKVGIWRGSRPVKSVDVLMSNNVMNSTISMWSGSVLLKYGTQWHLSEK